MDRLSIFLTTMTGAVIAGPIVVTAFVLGYYSFWPIAIAAGIAFVASWPVAYIISRRIKRQDPNWSRKPDGRILPDPNAPEV